MSKSFYITTTLPYVNADPHIGFALEIVQADIIARYRARMSMKFSSTQAPTSTDSRFFVRRKRKGRVRKNTAFIARGLEDFSISRLKEKMPWGVPVPNDEEHVMYVWFDALVNYISTLGWPEDTGNFEKFWGTKDAPNALQLAGKDNLRQQSAMWQAMLLSAGLPISKQIVIHGFITSGGQKCRKAWAT
jgi:methionyl-tRNA synthetase